MGDFEVMYHYGIMEHENVFWAIAGIMKISINTGEHLFKVDYSDM
jgi:hypothetical protein